MNKKLFLLLILLAGLGFTIQAQQTKKPLQFTPQVGQVLNLQNQAIYPEQLISTAPFYGLGIAKPLTKHFGIGLEGQYSSFNIGSNIEQAYGAYLRPPYTIDFKNTTSINGIFNLQYLGKRGKKGGNSAISLGMGLQQLTVPGNELFISDPTRGNLPTSVFKETKGKYQNPLLQLNLERTFNITRSIGLNLGLKSQYIKQSNPIAYKPTSIGDGNPEIFFQKSPTIEGISKNLITLIPTAGIRISLGGRTPKPSTAKLEKPQQKEEKPTKNTCFTAQWANAPKEESCFTGDKLEFQLLQKNIIQGATIYEVYLVPLNDLNNRELLFTKPYPTNTISVNANQLNANQAYAIIIILKNKDKTKECLQFIQPITRCEDACGDIKLPR
jgi:hypothetical protein